MQINGKEVNLFYSVGAKCEIDRAAIVNNCKNVGDMLQKLPTEAMLIAAVAMSKAYCTAYGGDAITRAEIETLPASQFDKLAELISDAINEGSATSVTTEAPKGKNARRADRSN